MSAAANNNLVNGILSALTGPIDLKLSQLQSNIAGDEETQENVGHF